MPIVRDESDRLTFSGVALADAALVTGTPAYVYDLDGIEASARALADAFGTEKHGIAYAVKANSAAEIIRLLARLGCGADVVSGAELGLALVCGIAPSRVVYSGVAKKDDELDRAIAADIGAIQVESVEEVSRIDARASATKSRARVSLRINPGVDREALDTHAHIATGHDEAKFGIATSDIPRALDAISQSKTLTLVGIGAHVGSQFTTVDPYLASARAVFSIAKDILPKFALEYVDTGGGFGIDYGQGCNASPADFVRATLAEKKAHGLDDLALHIEPGRSLVGSHGALITRILQRKVSGKRRWIMIDAGMNDLIRPALYQAKHRIEPCGARDSGNDMTATWRVVGPVCESSDDFGEHVLGKAPEGLLAILDAGAYGYTMASRYNGRALPAEIFLSHGRVAVARLADDDDAWIRDRLAAGRSM